MSTQTLWLENFTGLSLDTAGTVSEERRQEIEKQSKALDERDGSFELRRQAKAEALALVRGKLARIKTDVQKVFSMKINVDGNKGKLLEVEGTQRDEVHLDDLDNQLGKLPEEMRGKLKVLDGQIKNLSTDLEGATIELKGEKIPLFTPAEIQAEFWTPLKLERIYPESFIPPNYSETQQALNATRELYVDLCEQKEIAKELTPDRSLLNELLDSGSKLIGLAAEGVGEFGGEELSLVKEILTTGSEVLKGSQQVYNEIKYSGYGTAASSVLGVAGKLTTTLLSAFGAGDEAVKAAENAFSVSQQAVLMGKSLMKFNSGDGSVSEILELVGGMVSQALTAAADSVDEKDQSTIDSLSQAAKAVVPAFKAAKLAELPKLVIAGDMQGIVKSLAGLTKDVLGSLPGLKEDVSGQIDGAIELATIGAELIIKLTINAERGKYVANFSGALENIGNTLQKLLEAVGIDKGLAASMVSTVKASASPNKALEFMAANPPKIDEAINAITGGLNQVLAKTGDQALMGVGSALQKVLKDLVDEVDVKKYYDLANEDPSQCDLALQLVTTKLQGNIHGLVVLPKLEGNSPKADPEKLKGAAGALEEQRKKEELAADLAEAKLILDEKELDLNALSEAELAGSEASSVEKLIADLMRDRMVAQLAMQIAQGGAAFLAKFIPALGAASAGIKLFASISAAAERYQQLDKWVKSKDDLEAAQSALSSAAANFVKNQKSQFRHYAAQCLFAAAQLGGEIANLTGGAGIGSAVSFGASALSALEELLSDQKKKAEVEKAWKVTVKFLRNPNNRKLGLKALELNPTMAKLAISWGALELKDPLARKAVSGCGLTEASLKNPDADVMKVHKYLELYFEDDPTLYRIDKGDAPKWVPAEVHLNLLSWSQFSRTSDAKGGIAMAGSDAVDGLLAMIGPLEEAAEKSREAVDKETLEFNSLLNSRRLSLAKGSTAEARELPNSFRLEDALQKHSVNVGERLQIQQELSSAIKRCNPALKEPKDGEDPGLKAVDATLQRLARQAERTLDRVKEEQGNLNLEILELRMSVENAKREEKLRVTALNQPELAN